LSNAIKYNRDRDGTVSVSGQESPGRAYLIRVTDTGPGIPSEKVDRLFSPFDRIDTQTRIEGTGLGLALSKALTEAMGGRILVESLEGHGSTFSVEFPIGADPIPLSDSKVPSEDSLAAFPKGDQIILYVEDNMPNLSLMERILTHRPRVKLVAAMQGRLGVELAREHCPDLVLLDLHLPDISGEEALHLLRSDPRTRDIPVIVTSAEADSDSIQRLLAAGADDYLTKPLEVKRFLELVDAYLARPSDRLLARGT